MDKALVLLPAEHAWQRNFELQIGGWVGGVGGLLRQQLGGRAWRGGSWGAPAWLEARPTPAPHKGYGSAASHCSHPGVPGQRAALAAPRPCLTASRLLPYCLPGIRTGYCGCLTTFASWNLELITMAVSQNKVRRLQHTAMLWLPPPPPLLLLSQSTAATRLLPQHAAMPPPLRLQWWSAGRHHRPPCCTCALLLPSLQWGQAVGGYLAGMCSACLCYCVGLHAALAIDRWAASEHRGAGAHAVGGCPRPWLRTRAAPLQPEDPPGAGGGRCCCRRASRRMSSHEAMWPWAGQGW